MRELLLDRNQALHGLCTECGERGIDCALDNELEVFKARSIGGGGDANRECGLDCGDNLAESGVVVIQLAGHCDEGVG